MELRAAPAAMRADGLHACAAQSCRKQAPDAARRVAASFSAFELHAAETCVAQAQLQPQGSKAGARLFSRNACSMSSSSWLPVGLHSGHRHTLLPSQQTLDACTGTQRRARTARLLWERRSVSRDGEAPELGGEASEQESESCCQDGGREAASGPGRASHGEAHPSPDHDDPQEEASSSERTSGPAAENVSTSSSSSDTNTDGSTEQGSEDVESEGSQLAADWRAFRARLVVSEKGLNRSRPGDGGLGVSETLGDTAGDVSGVTLGDHWAHALYAPEKGCILVASELLHGYNFFQRSVILLLGVGTGPSDGPYGIALNKPFPRMVAQIDSIVPGLATTFGSCQVHVGGPIGSRNVLLVHGHKGLDGHCEVLPGVFVAGLGGMPAASQLVESGEAKADDFQVVLGYSGWGEEQLRQEIAQGWWYVAACSNDVILEAHRKCSGGEGDRVWKEILHLMGGEYADVGNRSVGEDA